jgi:hypothetical protein
VKGCERRRAPRAGRVGVNHVGRAHAHMSLEPAFGAKNWNASGTECSPAGRRVQPNRSRRLAGLRADPKGKPSSWVNRG